MPMHRKGEADTNVPEGFRRCIQCQEVQLIATSFHPRKKHVRHVCRRCRKAYRREWSRKKRERELAEGLREPTRNEWLQQAVTEVFE